MWYVIQTMTGKEENLINMIQKIIPVSYYMDCFCIKREGTRKIEEKYQVYLAPLFPGYVFILTETPIDLYRELRRIPQLTKLLRSEAESFLKVEKEEQIFLESIQDPTHIVKRSQVEVDQSGRIIGSDGPLRLYADCIVKQRLRKRRVWIEQQFLGTKRKIMLGIKLNSDEEN